MNALDTDEQARVNAWLLSALLAKGHSFAEACRLVAGRDTRPNRKRKSVKTNKRRMGQR